MMVYRGYAAALKGSGHEKKIPVSAPGSRRGSMNSRRDSIASNQDVNADEKKDKDQSPAKDKEKDKDKAKNRSGLRKSLDFAIGGVGMNRSKSANNELKPEPSVPPPTSRPNRQVSQIMEESINGQGGAYQKKKPQPKDAVDEEQVPLTSDEEGEEECTDLILVVHGIGELVSTLVMTYCAKKNDDAQGQQLATTYEGFNFVYAVNMLRQVMK
jgi:FtsZ-interacting cell division protein ZipA